MTTPLAARLAEALPHDPTGCDEVVGLCDGCHYRPAVLALIEAELARERERCAVEAEAWEEASTGDAETQLLRLVAKHIRALSANGE